VRVATQYAPPLSSIRERRGSSRGRADGNVTAVSHGQHVPTLTAAAALPLRLRGLVTLTF